MLKSVKSVLSLQLKTRIRNLLKLPPRNMGREMLAHFYLKGEGLEIGALHNPLTVGPKAKVRYVDRMSVPDLKKHYPELNNLPLVPVDIVDDGEHLKTIADGTQNFVIANHFIEHCSNPIETFRNLFRVLKKEGVLYITLPDKRFTFDLDRPVTPLEHLITDYQKGPEHSKRQHFEEWVSKVCKVEDPIKAKQEVERLLKMDYSIHYHVWTQSEMLEMFLALKQHLHVNFDIEACLKNGHEFIAILRKMS